METHPGRFDDKRGADGRLVQPLLRCGQLGLDLLALLQRLFLLTLQFLLGLHRPGAIPGAFPAQLLDVDARKRSRRVRGVRASAPGVGVLRIVRIVRCLAVLRVLPAGRLVRHDYTLLGLDV